ncbi:hypothetical protein B0O80DRAFT_247350 [Mortierella sp. GBAus27b]|nr:hypothetical protein B0O80DRAFT_247350 [Mortierella sp. GBAus27b]
MQPTPPLEFIEILSFVAINAQPRDLPSCLLISRPWHQVFLPFVWKDIVLDKQPIQNHRHLDPDSRPFLPLI